MPSPAWTSALAAPPRVEEAVVWVDSLPCERRTSGLLAWPGTSEILLGWKVRSEGAEPGGRVLAENSGALSLPTSTPGLCYYVLVMTLVDNEF